MQGLCKWFWKFGRKDFGWLAAMLGFFFLLAQCRGEGMVTITFDGSPTQPPGSRYSRTNYAERGTRFVGDCDRAFPPSSSLWPDNGTAYIVPAWQGMNCSRFDNLSFRLVSVDLAGYSTVVPDYTASFEGHRSDGSIVATNFAVSGLAFQTYYFSSEFADLTNVLVAAGALDNLKMQLPTIPPVMSIETYPYYYSIDWLRLQANGTLGLRYQLEYTDSLPSTNWTPLAEFESSFFQSLPISTKTNSAQRFFRAVELP
jgi:hypothetical protein